MAEAVPLAVPLLAGITSGGCWPLAGSDEPGIVTWELIAVPEALAPAVPASTTLISECDFACFTFEHLYNELSQFIVQMFKSEKGEITF